MGIASYGGPFVFKGGKVVKKQKLEVRRAGQETVSNEMRSPYLTVEEAADFLKIRLGTFRGWLASGNPKHIPGRKHGRRWVFVASELMDWSQHYAG